MDLWLEHQDNLHDDHKDTDSRDTKDEDRQSEHEFEESFHIFRGQDA